MASSYQDDVPDEFEDAVEQINYLDFTHERANIPASQTKELDVALKEVKIAADLFFNNKFLEAKDMLQPCANSSCYHALGNGVFAYLQAIMTFEQKDIEHASSTVKQAIAVCNNYRRKTTITSSIGRMVKKKQYDSYTEEEIHAELCYAECILLKSVLTFIEDETLINFVKGGLKIRACYQSYKECWQILNHRHWDKETHTPHFESGVRMGAGSFNLLISLLPQRVMKLLEFIGFTGSRAVGLCELEKGYRQRDSIRRVLCAMILLGFHLIVVYVMGNDEGDLALVDTILQEQLQLYPEGVWFLFFKGRLEFVQGHFDESITWYEKSWHSQDVWPQCHHMCFWELMWNHCFKKNWKAAEDFANKLFTDSRWSKCIYAYMKAAFLFARKEEKSISDSENKELVSLMRDLPAWKQRFAGKSLPMEKFVIKKSNRFFAQNERLLLPALELIYVWNGMRILAKQWSLIEGYYRLVERALKDLDKRKKEKYYWDDFALTLLLKGCCLRYMGSPLQAEECLLQVTKLDKQLQDDFYLIPYSVAELGFLYQSMDKNEQATVWLEAAKNNYKSYSLESRLHFRIHSALNQLKSSGDKIVNDSVEIMGLEDDQIVDDADSKLK